LVFASLLAGFLYYQEIEKRFVAELNCPTQKNKTLIFDHQRIPEKIIVALKMEPMNSDCLIKLASTYETTATGEMIQTNYVKNSPQIIKKAITLNPVQGRYYYLLGTEYYFKSLKEPERRGELMALSVQAYQSTLQYQPGFSGDILNRIKAWLERDRNKAEALPNTKIAMIGLLKNIYRLNTARENEIRKAMESYFSTEELDRLVFAEKKGLAEKPIIKIRENI